MCTIYSQLSDLNKWCHLYMILNLGNLNFSNFGYNYFPPWKSPNTKFSKKKKDPPPPLQKGEIFLFTLFFSTFMAFLNYVLNNLNKYTIKYMLTINCTITYLRGYTMESPLYSLSYQLVLHGIQGLLQGVSPSA